MNAKSALQNVRRRKTRMLDERRIYPQNVRLGPSSGFEIRVDYDSKFETLGPLSALGFV